MQAGDTDHGIGFINGAIGLYAHIIFGNARAIAKGGFALVTGFCIDTSQLNHVPSVILVCVFKAYAWLRNRPPSATG